MKYRKVRALNPNFDPRTLPRKGRRKSNPCGCETNPPVPRRVPPVYPAEADILRQLHEHRERYLKAPLRVPVRLHRSEIAHPKGTSATVDEILRSLSDRGLIEIGWEGSVSSNLSAQQFEELQEINARTQRLAGRLGRGETR